jgi:hypothetical protein
MITHKLVTAAKNAVKLADAIRKATPEGQIVKRWIDDAGKQAAGAVADARKQAGRLRVPTMEELHLLLTDAHYAAAAYRDKDAKDEGSCVIGAGIVLRDPLTGEHARIVDAPFQGNIGSHRALAPVLAYLRKQHPAFDLAWYDGVID